MTLLAHFALTADLGNALVGLLVALVGYILNEKTKKIHFLVNQRMTDAIAEIHSNKRMMIAQAERIVALEALAGVEHGEPIPPLTNGAETT